MKSVQSRCNLVAVALSAAAFGFAASHAAAQAFPARNVQVIVPYPAGGSIDVITRAVAVRLAEIWGKNVVVDNRPGASGMIGTELARAEADGHTLLGHTSSYPATAAVREKLPFDPARAIVPVGMFARAPMILAIHPSVPAKTVKELVALAKKNPGTLNYSSSGTGGNNHFSGALFAAAGGIKMTHIPYKGIAPAVTRSAAGEVELVIASAAAVNPQLKANRIRGVTSAEPSPLLPGLPAIAQSGVPGYTYELWWGMFAPAGISAERVGVINTAINKAGNAGNEKISRRRKHRGVGKRRRRSPNCCRRKSSATRKRWKLAGIQPQ